MALVTLQQKIKHLYWRAGCGPALEDFHSTDDIRIHVDKIFSSAEKFTPIALSEIRKAVTTAGNDETEAVKTKISPKAERIKLGYILVDKLVHDDSFLREKMAFFWSNHFACQSNLAPLALDYANSIRQHALGSFRKLLPAISKSPAMMAYLNTKKNKKKSPNENFARELMELFTLGRGHYSETDVREAARSFAGWSFDKQLNFYVNTPYQDTDLKTFMGKTGNFSGDDILNIILENRQCARFIAGRIYRYFVNDQVDWDRVEMLGEFFYKADYDIAKLMHHIFTSDWFYDEKNRGTKIKSPIDLLAGLMKTFEVRFHDVSRFLAYMRMTGQVIFQPPNVAGWPVGRGWIDNSLLMVRLNVPFWIFEKRHPLIAPKENYDAQDVMMGKDTSESPEALITYDFHPVSEFLKNTERSALAVPLMELMLPTGSPALQSRLMEGQQVSVDPVKSIVLRIASLPEYQLC